MNAVARVTATLFYASLAAVIGISALLIVWTCGAGLDRPARLAMACVAIVVIALTSWRAIRLARAGGFQ